MAGRTYTGTSDVYIAPLPDTVDAAYMTKLQALDFPSLGAVNCDKLKSITDDTEPKIETPQSMNAENEGILTDEGGKISIEIQTLDPEKIATIMGGVATLSEFTNGTDPVKQVLWEGGGTQTIKGFVLFIVSQKDGIAKIYNHVEYRKGGSYSNNDKKSNEYITIKFELEAKGSALNYRKRGFSRSTPNIQFLFHST